VAKFAILAARDCLAAHIRFSLHDSFVKDYSEHIHLHLLKDFSRELSILL
jgi:hypothetical protein